MNKLLAILLATFMLTSISNTANAKVSCEEYANLAVKVMDLRQHGVKKDTLLAKAPDLEGIIIGAYDYPQATSEAQADEFGQEFKLQVLTMCTIK